MQQPQHPAPEPPQQERRLGSLSGPSLVCNGLVPNNPILLPFLFSNHLSPSPSLNRHAVLHTIPFFFPFTSQRLFCPSVVNVLALFLSPSLPPSLPPLSTPTLSATMVFGWGSSSSSSSSAAPHSSSQQLHSYSKDQHVQGFLEHRTFKRGTVKIPVEGGTELFETSFSPAVDTPPYTLQVREGGKPIKRRARSCMSTLFRTGVDRGRGCGWGQWTAEGILFVHSCFECSNPRAVCCSKNPCSSSLSNLPNLSPFSPQSHLLHSPPPPRRSTSPATSPPPLPPSP